MTTLEDFVKLLTNPDRVRILKDDSDTRSGRKKD